MPGRPIPAHDLAFVDFRDTIEVIYRPMPTHMLVYNFQDESLV